MVAIRQGAKYGVIIDEEDLDENGHSQGVWGFECFPDGLKVEKRMDDIIITAANYALHPGPNGQPPKCPGGYHFSWMGTDPIEDPKRPLEA